MSVEAPYPDLVELLAMVGEVGWRLSEIGASEGAAGNISVYVSWPVDPRRLFPVQDSIELPVCATEAIGQGGFLVTGSGRRLREIKSDPVANLGYVAINDDGQTGRLYTSHRRLFTRLTSEFNSHLAVHCDQIRLTGTNFHAVVHAQPLHLTYLSHIPRYQDEEYLNRHILRWQPESIMNLPEGVGFIPFQVPGSAGLMAATTESLRRHRVTVWAKHGVVARSDVSVKRACDRIEYAETGAHYEYMNLLNGESAQGLTTEEIAAICRAYQVEQSIY